MLCCCFCWCRFDVLVSSSAHPLFFFTKWVAQIYLNVSYYHRIQSSHILLENTLAGTWKVEFPMILATIWGEAKCLLKVVLIVTIPSLPSSTMQELLHDSWARVEKTQKFTLDSFIGHIRPFSRSSLYKLHKFSLFYLFKKANMQGCLIALLRITPSHIGISYRLLERIIHMLGCYVKLKGSRYVRTMLQSMKRTTQVSSAQTILFLWLMYV